MMKSSSVPFASLNSRYFEDYSILNGDIGFTEVNQNFRKQILVSPLWFASQLVPWHFICNSASIYFGVLFLCVQELETYLISPAEALHQSVFVLELEERSTMIFVQHLCVTGLTGYPNQSDRLKILFSVLSVGPVSLTGLTNRCADKLFQVL